MPGGLDTHLPLDLGGQACFGWDVELIEWADFEVHRVRVESLYPAMRRYWPDLSDSALCPDYTGIRSMLHGLAEPCADYPIDGQQIHEVTGLVNLFGSESPGLASALAIADHVAKLLSYARVSTVSL